MNVLLRSVNYEACLELGGTGGSWPYLCPAPTLNKDLLTAHYENSSISLNSRDGDCHSAEFPAEDYIRVGQALHHSSAVGLPTTLTRTMDNSGWFYRRFVNIAVLTAAGDG